MALIRHAHWYMKTRDTDALRARPGAEKLSLMAVRDSCCVWLRQPT